MGILEKLKNGALGKLGGGILDAMFPARCLGCGSEGQYTCSRCEDFTGESALICPACEQTSFSGERHGACENTYGLDGLVSIWEYEGIAKALVHFVKYDGVTHAAKEAIARAFFVMARDKERFGAFLSFLLARPSLSEGGLARLGLTEEWFPIITFVPMYGKKERYRGFNQAEVFAKELGRIAGLEVCSMAERIKDTKAQADLTKEERLRSVRGVFRAKFQICERSEGGDIGGEEDFKLQTMRQVQNSERGSGIKKAIKRCARVLMNDRARGVSLSARGVVLVDDVWTTGATMRECCNVLKRAGVQKVWGFTLARTV